LGADAGTLVALAIPALLRPFRAGKSLGQVNEHEMFYADFLYYLTELPPCGY
jgi:hypothetical protein